MTKQTSVASVITLACAAITTSAQQSMPASSRPPMPDRLHEMGDMKGMDAARPAASSAQMTHMAHTATAVVKRVDAKAGLVTLAHEPVKSMNWPAMTMGFQVKDKLLFDKLAVGKKVDFEFVQSSKGYVVTVVK